MAAMAKTFTQTGTINSTFTTTSIDLTDQQSVAIVSSITVPTTVTGTVVAQWSLNEITWVNIDSPETLTNGLVFNKLIDLPSYKFIRILFTVTAGSINHATQTFVRSYSS